MNIAVCDDQESVLQSISELLLQYQKSRGIHLNFRLFSNAGQMLEAAQQTPFCAYLLDVIMPDMDGMCAAQSVRAFDASADIVFLTTSKEFAFESYQVHATDYLLKPIDPNTFFDMLDRVYKHRQSLDEGLSIKYGGGILRIPFHKLSFVEVNGKHLYFNLTDGSVREVYGVLREYGPLLLDHKQFIQVHRSYIVNLLQVEEVAPAYVRTFCGKQVPVSRLQAPQLQKAYMALLFDRKER